MVVEKRADANRVGRKAMGRWGWGASWSAWAAWEPPGYPPGPGLVRGRTSPLRPYGRGAGWRLMRAWRTAAPRPKCRRGEVRPRTRPGPPPLRLSCPPAAVFQVGGAGVIWGSRGLLYKEEKQTDLPWKLERSNGRSPKDPEDGGEEG